MPHLILIHIGPTYPTYMNDCIQQLQEVSSIDIHVLVPRAHHDAVVVGVTVCALEDIPETTEISMFNSLSRHSTAFRNGFWKFTTMRFFYLHAYTQWKGLHDIFHIEYDNLIYEDFLPALPIFREKEMWGVMDHPNRCIPSFLYFRDTGIQADLLQCLLQLAPLAQNDMQSLAIFMKSHPDRVGWLPIVVNYTGGEIDPRYSAHATRFGCLFDGAWLGQYVGGVDPRNTPGDTRGFINETCVVRCDRADFHMSARQKPTLNDLPVVNLHIHSKDLKRWRLLKEDTADGR